VEKEFEQFRSILATSKNVILTTHLNPDADGIGCELALASYLRSAGKQVSILNHSETPDNIRFLDVNQQVRHFDSAKHSGLFKSVDLICVLDTNHPDRIADLKPYILESKAKKVCIDHHLEPDSFADLYILDEASTATGEIIFKLITFLDPKAVTNEVADCLYSAIMTDTGSFRYPKTDPEIHRIIAKLIEAGADPTAIYQNIYDENTPQRLRLLGSVLSTLKTAESGKVVYMTITRQMFTETGTSEMDTDAFVPYALSIQGAQIGLLFTELENDVIKISFRSKRNIWINKLAREFGGNGHQHAAGARVHNANLHDVMRSVLEKAQKYIE
jgi:bifunctional oligoribonuclease and PAP phosphatase NrnA